MKTIKVVAAVIQRQKNDKKEIFVTQRGYGVGEFLGVEGFDGRGGEGLV